MHNYLVRVLVVLLHVCFSVVGLIPFLLAAFCFSGHPYIRRKYYRTSRYTYTCAYKITLPDRQISYTVCTDRCNRHFSQWPLQIHPLIPSLYWKLTASQAACNNSVHTYMCAYTCKHTHTQRLFVFILYALIIRCKIISCFYFRGQGGPRKYFDNKKFQIYSIIENSKI